MAAHMFRSYRPPRAPIYPNGESHRDGAQDLMPIGGIEEKPSPCATRGLCFCYPAKSRSARPMQRTRLWEALSAAACWTLLHIGGT